jgi:hypothetical protein
MSEPTFRTRVRAFYEGQQLPEERLERLRGLAQASRPRVSRRRLAMAGLAAALVVGAAGAFLLSGRAGDINAEMAREVALNHRKQIDPEFLSESYEEIGARMPRLDFQVAEPRGPQTEGLRLVGARYCSLQGCVAAQLRLVAADGRFYTLYEVRDGSAFDGIEPARIEVEAVAVQIWREGGLVLGLAVDTD